MQKITIKIDQDGLAEVEQITGGEMNPIEFLRNVVDAAMFHLYYESDMTAEEIFFEMSSAAKDCVDVINEPDEEDFSSEIEKVVDGLMKTHEKGGENTPPDNTHLN